MMGHVCLITQSEQTRCSRQPHLNGMSGNSACWITANRPLRHHGFCGQNSMLLSSVSRQSNCINLQHSLYDSTMHLAREVARLCSGFPRKTCSSRCGTAALHPPFFIRHLFSSCFGLDFIAPIQHFPFRVVEAELCATRRLLGRF